MNLKGIYQVAPYIDRGDYYDDMSWSEIDSAYNGIGAEWMPDEARELLDKWFTVFRDAIIIHDCDYQRSLTLEEKLADDVRLLRNMRRCIRHIIPFWHIFKRLELFSVADFFYVIVTKWGDDAFWQGKKQNI